MQIQKVYIIVNGRERLCCTIADSLGEISVDWFADAYVQRSCVYAVQFAVLYLYLLEHCAFPNNIYPNTFMAFVLWFAD